jgi:hypothetical protein
LRGRAHRECAFLKIPGGRGSWGSALLLVSQDSHRNIVIQLALVVDIRAGVSSSCRPRATSAPTPRFTHRVHERRHRPRGLASLEVQTTECRLLSPGRPQLLNTDPNSPPRLTGGQSDYRASRRPTLKATNMFYAFGVPGSETAFLIRSISPCPKPIPFHRAPCPTLALASACPAPVGTRQFN